MAALERILKINKHSATFIKESRVKKNNYCWEAWKSKSSLNTYLRNNCQCSILKVDEMFPSGTWKLKSEITWIKNQALQTNMSMFQRQHFLNWLFAQPTHTNWKFYNQMVLRQEIIWGLDLIGFLMIQTQLLSNFIKKLF